MDTITIYVTSFTPAGNDGGGGGFFWHRDKDAATRAYTEQARESVREKGSHIVRLVPLTLPNIIDEQITDMIEHDHMDDIEGEAPALRQYVPAHTEPLFIPTGGIIRKGRTMSSEALTALGEVAIKLRAEHRRMTLKELTGTEAQRNFYETKRYGLECAQQIVNEAITAHNA